MRYDLIPYNPVKGKVEKLKEAEPKRTRLSGEQVQALLKVAGCNRALLATAIMAGGLRVSELTHLRWRDLDLKAGVLRVPVSKTAAGLREIALEAELVQLLREHKVAAKWSEPDDFIFAGRIREKPRERNSVHTKILYPAIERANAQLASEDRPLFPEGVTFHSLRRTYAALRAAWRAPSRHRRSDGPPRSPHDPPRLHRRHRDEATHSDGRPPGRGRMGTIWAPGRLGRRSARGGDCCGGAGKWLRN